MIKTEHGNITVNGDKANLMSDLSIIVKDLTEKHGLSKDDIDCAVKTAYLSTGEIVTKILLNYIPADVLADCKKEDE